MDPNKKRALGKSILDFPIYNLYVFPQEKKYPRQWAQAVLGHVDSNHPLLSIALKCVFGVLCLGPTDQQ